MLITVVISSCGGGRSSGGGSSRDSAVVNFNNCQLLITYPFILRLLLFLDPVTAAKVQFVRRDHISTFFEDASLPPEMAHNGH